MKKILISLLFISSLAGLYAQIPENLYGIWEGKDRYVFFERVQVNSEANPLDIALVRNSELEYEDRIVIILKEYYGWYLDRAAEAPEYSNEYKRSRNLATPRKAIYVVSDSKDLWIPEVELDEYGNEIPQNSDSAAYEMKLVYDKHDITYVPFAYLNDRIYLEFWLQSEEHPGFWKGNVVTEGIKVSNQVEKENIWSWYENRENGEFFRLRFWKSKMDYDPELEAVIKSGENEYYIDKHLFSAENVYTCVPGRRLYIRNLDKSPAEKLFDGKNILKNNENTITAVNEVYLQKLLDKESFEDLLEIVKTQNSKRKPAPPPLFPPEELDYHWDLIDRLEKDNKIIQEVRKRQADFGVRGKDLGR